MSEYLVELWDDPNGVWVAVTFRGVRVERQHALDIEEATTIARGLIEQLTQAAETNSLP